MCVCVCGWVDFIFPLASFTLPHFYEFLFYARSPSSPQLRRAASLGGVVTPDFLDRIILIINQSIIVVGIVFGFFFLAYGLFVAFFFLLRCVSLIK